jgi:hypothetical protein
VSGTTPLVIAGGDTMNDFNQFEPNDPAATAEPAGKLVPEANATVEEADGAETISWSRFGSDPLPSLPKMAAVNRAYKAGVDFGLPEGFASTLAHAAVDPAALRAALNHPTTMNVAGGAIEVIDIDLYVPGLVPLPTNNRTMDNRVYPAGGAIGYPGPLSGPRSAPGVTSDLWIDAHNVQHALEETKRGADYILVKNPLKDSVGERGIVMPVTVVYFEMRHRDEQPVMPLLGTADGSSRIASAHALLNLTDPRTTHYDMPTNRDSYRRFVDSLTSPEIESMGATAAQRLKRQRNALITPARIFLRFTPQPNLQYDFARAVAAYVGMLHVDPPRPWTPTGKLEAMAEAVLEVLRSARVLDDAQHDYLAGLLTPDAAEAAGLPTLRDEQAAYVLATLLQQDLRDLIDRGIMDVTAKKSVTAPRRNDVIAELALRPTRSEAVTLPVGDPTRDRANAMRASYLRATHFPLYSASPWQVTGRSPDDILKGALDELERPEAEQGNPSAWQNRLELAALAQYHLTAHGVLKREPVGNKNADQRGPQEILKLMLDDGQGIRLLRQAIVDGREGITPRLVDENGHFVRETPKNDDGAEQDANLPPEKLTDVWLRHDGFPSGGKTNCPVSMQGESPAMKAARVQRNVLDLINQLATHLDELDRLEGPGGGVLLDQRGWPASDTKGAMEALVDAQSRFGYWGKVADRQVKQVDQEVGDEYSEESDEDNAYSTADDWEA